MWPTLNETLSSFCSSTFWDPHLLFFTRCFEGTVLIWFPCAFLWIFTPLEVYHLRRSREASIRVNSYCITKLIMVGLAGVTVLVETTTAFFLDNKPFSAHITAALKFFTLCLLLGLTYANIKYGVRSSAILFIFSFLLAVCGVPQLLHLSGSTIDTINQVVSVNSILYATYYLSVLTVFLLNCFVGSQPVAGIPLDEKNLSPEKKSSFLSRLLYSWIGGFTWRGYRSPLTGDDLWDLDRKKRTAQNVGRFESRFSRIQRHRHQKSTREMLLEDKTNETDSNSSGIGLLLSLLKTYQSSIFYGALALIAYTSTTFAGPFILNSVLEFASSEHEELEWRGFFYVFSFLVVGIFKSISLNYAFYELLGSGFLIRTALASVIYKKALRISNGAKKAFSFGEIVNLMAVDAARFETIPMVLLFFILYIIEIIVSFYCLWNILGPSVIAGVGVLVFLMIVGGFFISQHLVKLQTKQMQYKDKRIKLTNEVVSGMKVLKMYACEPNFEKCITKIRNKEVRIMKKIAYLHAVSSFVWICSPFLVSFATFGAYVLSDEKNILTPQIAFVSLSLFNIMKEAFKWVPHMIRTATQSSVAIKRINKFLNSEELDLNAVSHGQRAESIVVEDGEFSWDSYEGASVLHNINLKVNQGDLVAVVGTVGSGKTSLLSAILGEMYRKSGYVNTTGRLAYVPQQAWIQNATLRDNITFGEKARRPFYDAVLEACALIPDLEILPAGDQTEVGEKGLNMSGGQKQRISLARAVYSDADTYLFDDPLSAVDVHVGKHIFEKVIGPNGLLRNKTRIFVTHNLAYLPQADHIVCLQNCIISEMGTYNELLSRGGDLASLLGSYTKENAEGVETGQENIQSDKDGQEQTPQKTIPKVEGDNGAVEDERHALTEAEIAQTGNIKWTVCIYFLRAVGLLVVLAMLLTNVCYQVFSVSTDYWLSAWSSHNALPYNGTNGSRTSEQFEYLTVYALLGVGQAANVVLHTIVVYLGLLRASKYIHNDLLVSLFHWPTRIFDRIPSGRIMNRLGYDVEVLDNILPTNFLKLLLHAAVVIANLTVITYNTPLFLGVFLPVIGVYFFVQRVYVAASRQLKRMESVSKSPIYSHFGDSITGAQSIRAYGLQTKFIETSQSRIDLNLKCAYAGMIVDRWFGIRSDALSSVIIFSVALFSILARDIIGTAIVGLTITYALQVTVDLYWWIHMCSEVTTNVVAVERIKEYSEMEQEAAWIEPSAMVPKDWLSVGEVTFENLEVRYHETMEPVLRGISFNVSGGEKVGIIGRTGAGKTSLTLSLFRIIEASGGNIRIDGVDISKIGLHALRSQLTIIPQDPILFSGTLRVNLDLSDEYSDDHIWRTLKLINLESYMPSLVHGLQYEVEEGGSNFSIGQRQLICLARALLRKTKVLILDEATAAIDFETDNLIQEIIRREFHDCTVLTIAHRLNTIIDYDRIMVLDAGRIVEFNSPKVLLESKDSIFYSMAVGAGLI